MLGPQTLQKIIRTHAPSIDNATASRVARAILREARLDSRYCSLSLSSLVRARTIAVTSAIRYDPDVRCALIHRAIDIGRFVSTVAY